MSGEIVEAEVVDGSVEFETGSFSVFVFTGYTVDFHWGEYTYNLKGGSTIFLSELLETLINGASEGENKALEGEETADAAVEVDNSTGETENRSQANGSAGVYDTTTENARLAEIIADMSRVKSVTFSNPKLVKVEQKSSEQAENDWLLTSLAAFDTEEILTIRLADGSEIVVRVTDEQEGDLVPLTIEKKWDESIDWTSEPYASQKAANQTIEFLIYGKTNDSDPGTQITAYAESSGNTAVSSISESDHTDDISKWAKTVYVPKSVKVTENNEQAVKTFTSYTIEEVNLETAQGTRGSWDDPIVDYQEGKEEYKEYSTNVLPDGTRLYSAGDYPSETHLRLVAYGNWSISNITSVTIEYSVNNGKYNFSTKANFSSAKKLESNNNGHPEYIYRLKLLTAGDKDYKPIFKKLYINGVEEPVGSNQRITTAVIENGTLGGEYPWDLDVSSSGTTVNYSVMEMNRKLTVTNSFSLPVEEKVPVIVNKVWDDRITWTDSYFENWKDLNKEILLTVDGEAKTLKDSDSVATSELARNGQSSYKDATEHNAALQSFSKLFYVDNGFDATKLQEGTLQKPDDKYVWTNTIEETEWNKWVNLTDSGHTQKGYIHLHSNTSVKNSDTNEYQGVKKIIFQYTDGVNNDIIYQSTANVTNATLNEEGANYYIEVLLPSNVDMSSLTLANPQKYQYTPQGELRFAIQVCRTGEYYVNNLPKSVQGRARTAAEPETRYDNVSFCKSVPSGGKKIEATSNTLKAYFPTQYTITNSLSICKILDTDGVEHGFPTLNAAVTYSRNTATRDKAYAVDDGNGGKQCKIEMLVDYVIPSTDKVTLDSGTLSVNGTDVDYTDNIIITTADKIGNAGYKYTGKGDTATITRGFTLASAEDTDNNQLFTVTGDGAMLTFTNIIIDGDKTNHSGGKGSLVYVKGEKTNVPVLVIGTGATLQNAKSSGSTGGGAVYVTHGTVTVAAGGSIQNCVAENSDGGAIYAEKTGAVININGSLTGNSAEDGGAIKASGGVFINIYPGATLSGNTASKKGGAIYISGSVNMTGGSIDNNTAAQKGAGIYADSDGSISFSGSPVVYDNKVNDKQWNVEFSGNNNTSIKLSGELDDSAKIGVYAPGGHNKAGEPFGTAMSNTEANLEGFTNDRDETLFGVNAQDMGHTGSLIYWGRYICKIEDNNNVGKGTKQIGETNRYEHPFTTLNKALGYARNGFNNGSTMSGSNAASIQMLVDYVIPSTDIVTLNESTDNIIITTAATSGGIYNFTDTQEKKADEDKGTAILTRGFNGTDLFTVSNASAKLTTTDIIFDGDREGIVTGTARSGRAINASQANATVIIKDGSTFRNFYISGNSANGSVINTTGNLTLLNEEKEGTIRFDNNQTTGYGGSVYVSKVMTVSGGTDSKGEEIGNPGTVWFNNSKSGNDGGAVFCNGFRMNKNSGTLKFTDCATVGNGDYEGGAIQVQSNDFLIEKNTGLVHFENCYTDQTSGEGGAVSVFKSAKLTIECTENGNAKFINCAAAKTSGSAGGGALFTYDNGLNIITVTAENGSVLFENCSAKGAGGAIYQEKGLSIEFKNVKFINCTSGSNGGAVYTPGAIGMIGASFENCQAINGGGVYSKQDMSAAGEVSFSGCTASKAGGAIYDESFFLLNETVLIPQLSWGSNKSGSDKRSNIN
ncbi:hypothetical protein [Oribacterium sp. NK2B42]|uniref:hypothetical protein n=1 Tax=Oribacterium sp. NK2B42 TaxID=689781 RepID=UPI0003F707D9|nr:hypothetical protein [Oribacterium sp. NK2B42]